MEIFWAVVMLAVGIVLVVKGGDFFVDAASRIAKAAGIPTFIIGATIVSLATTMPEMIVSCIAAADGKTDMAIGNAVGSVTANTALIMAIAFVFMQVVIARKAYIVQCIMLIACAAVLLIGSLSGALNIFASVALIVIFALFMALNLRNAKAHADAADKSEKVSVTKGEIAKNSLLFLVGAGAIVGGSQLLVNGGSALATVLGVPERIIAVTLVAVGTSLPELVTTLTAIRKKESALSVGNIIGANIIDLSLILPLCSLISGKELPISQASLLLDLPVCLGVILLGVVPLLIREKASRLQGVLMLAVYAGYLALTL